MMNRKAIFHVRTEAQATAQQASDDLTTFLTQFGISTDDFTVYEFGNEIQLRYASPEVQKAIIALLAWDQFVQKNATTSPQQMPEFAGSPKVDVQRLIHRRFDIGQESIPIEL